MPSNADTLVHALLRGVLDRVLRTECLALRGLRVQAKGHHGLLDGDVAKRWRRPQRRALTVGPKTS